MEFRKEKGGRDTTHFNADSSNTELMFRTVHSANQLSVSTQQSQAGLKSSLNGKREQAATEKCETARREFFGAKLQGATIRHLEKYCENVFGDLKHWRKKFNLREFVKV